MPTAPHPSQRYRALVHLYARMHLEGDPANALAAETLFDGRALTPHVETVRRLLLATGARSLLDYGCGKAKAYRTLRARHPDGSVSEGAQALWGLDSVALYDPAVRAHARLPEGPFDAVVSTAVLEYVPEEDLDWVLAEIVAFARRLVFLSIACHPSPARLPNGENYHVTQRSPGWWCDRLIAALPAAQPPRLFALLWPDEKQRVLLEI